MKAAKRRRYFKIACRLSIHDLLFVSLEDPRRDEREEEEDQ